MSDTRKQYSFHSAANDARGKKNGNTMRGDEVCREFETLVHSKLKAIECGHRLGQETHANDARVDMGRWGCLIQGIVPEVRLPPQSQTMREERKRPELLDSDTS